MLSPMTMGVLVFFVSLLLFFCAGFTVRVPYGRTGIEAS